MSSSNGTEEAFARTLDELQAVVEQQMQYYNRERRHSGLGYQPPLAYLHTEGFAA